MDFSFCDLCEVSIPAAEPVIERGGERLCSGCAEGLSNTEGVARSSPNGGQARSREAVRSVGDVNRTGVVIAVLALGIFGWASWAIRDGRSTNSTSPDDASVVSNQADALRHVSGSDHAAAVPVGSASTEITLDPQFLPSTAYSASDTLLIRGTYNGARPETIWVGTQKASLDAGVFEREVPLDPGLNTVYVRSGSWSHTAVVIRDMDDPELFVDDPETGDQPLLVRDSSFTIYARASDDYLEALEVRGADSIVLESEDTSPLRASLPLAEGVNEFVVVARDRAGREAREVVVVTRDTLRPEITIVNPPVDAEVEAGELEVVVSLDEPVELVTIDREEILQEATEEPGSLRFRAVVTVSDTGLVMIPVTARDLAGNESVLAVHLKVHGADWTSGDEDAEGLVDAQISQVIALEQAAAISVSRERLDEIAGELGDIANETVDPYCEALARITAAGTHKRTATLCSDPWTRFKKHSRATEQVRQILGASPQMIGGDSSHVHAARIGVPAYVACLEYFEDLIRKESRGTMRSKHRRSMSPYETGLARCQLVAWND